MLSRPRTTPSSMLPKQCFSSKVTSRAATKGSRASSASGSSKPGGFPKSSAFILRELKDERENGDYSIFPAISAEDAERAVASAERFVAALEAFLQAQGFATVD